MDVSKRRNPYPLPGFEPHTVQPVAYSAYRRFTIIRLLTVVDIGAAGPFPSADDVRRRQQRIFAPVFSVFLAVGPAEPV
jgi:hypothetical protein